MFDLRIIGLRIKDNTLSIKNRVNGNVHVFFTEIIAQT